MVSGPYTWRQLLRERPIVLRFTQLSSYKECATITAFQRPSTTSSTYSLLELPSIIALRSRRKGARMLSKKTKYESGRLDSIAAARGLGVGGGRQAKAHQRSQNRGVHSFTVTQIRGNRNFRWKRAVQC